MQRTFVFVILFLLAGGCTSTYLTLPSEKQVPPLAALIRQAEAVPQQTLRIPVRTVSGRTIRVALHESGPADAPRTIVLIHGVLSDADTWRYIRAPLAAEHRVIAVDLPGSGASDAPQPGDLGPDGYAPAALSNAVLDAIGQRVSPLPAASAQAQQQPGRAITLIGHSLGGMLVLRMLSDERIRRQHADVLDRVDGVVLFTPIDVAVEKEPPTFRAIIDATDSQFAIARTSGLLREKVAISTRDSVCNPDFATREEADRLIRILANPRTRHAHQSMLRSAVPWSHSSRRPDWLRIERLVARYDRVQPRCLIVWGARDELFPLSMGYKLAVEIQPAHLRIVPDGMHSLPTEHPATCAALIHEFLSEPDPPQRIARLASETIGD